MLTMDQRILFENIISALDRVFDRESKVVDLYALVFATAVALRGSEFAAAAELPIRELKRWCYPRNWRNNGGKSR